MFDGCICQFVDKRVVEMWDFSVACEIIIRKWQYISNDRWNYATDSDADIVKGGG